jgi:CheY-like chemotaxis protein/anti-sigma regulatory factor (Ser/Thr protein kinase)
MNKAVVQSERLKAIGEMATGIAHNFNNLLQVMITRSQMAMRQIDKGKSQQARVEIGHVLAAATSAVEIIKRLQDFSRPADTEIVELLERFDLSEVVTRSLEVCEPYLSSEQELGGRTISIQTQLVENCYISGKQSEITEVVVNLIKNAIEALSENGFIWVETKKTKDSVVLMVKDTGVGIEKENLTKVFEPFWTTKGNRGTGMGLASSFGIVQSHGGKFKVHSEVGKGSAFLIQFPAAVFEEKESAVSVSGLFKTKHKFILIDDTESVLETLESALLTYGHEVLSFSSPKTALKNFDWSADVVICDLGMPELNGLQVGKKIKEASLRKKKKMPFVLLTGWASSEDLTEDQLEESGVDLVLGKPITLDNFMLNIGSLLGVFSE